MCFQACLRSPDGVGIRSFIVLMDSRFAEVFCLYNVGKRLRDASYKQCGNRLTGLQKLFLEGFGYHKQTETKGLFSGSRVEAVCHHMVTFWRLFVT